MAKVLHSDQQLLRDLGKRIEEIFNGEACFQVGTSLSAHKSKTYRDIDLRVMLDSKDFKKLQKLINIDLLSFVISLYGQKITGLPIDFQVQDVDYANERHKGYRSAVSIGGIAQGDGYPKDQRQKNG